jgi:phosphoglycolate phosphatase
MMKRKIIIFDLDGVLFDSTSVAALYMKKRYKGMTDEMQKELLTGNWHEEVAKLSHLKIPETEEEKKERNEEYSKVKSEVLMFKGTKELLLDLHSQGYLLALNTSAWDRNCVPLLDKARIATLFDVLGTAELGRSKVEKFKMIKEKYSLNESEMLFVTDTLGDVREADLAHVPTVAVTWGAHDEGYFNREPHENLIAIASSVDELRDVIEKNNP